MRENPLGTFIIILCLIWAVERMVVAFINRNKPPTCRCDNCDDDDEDEVIAMGGQVEEDEDES